MMSPDANQPRAPESKPTSKPEANDDHAVEDWLDAERPVRKEGSPK